jgi:hypothetical protein
MFSIIDLLDLMSTTGSDPSARRCNDLAPVNFEFGRFAAVEDFTNAATPAARPPPPIGAHAIEPALTYVAPALGWR